MRPVGDKEYKTLLALKEAEHAAKGLPFDGEFYLWDYRYYDRIFIEKELELDDLLVKEYFPVSVVVPAILDIYQKLLGVKFVEAKGETWHPGESGLLCMLSRESRRLTGCCLDVQQFSVWEDGATDESGFVGYCYLDLFPRGTPSLILSFTHHPPSHDHTLMIIAYRIEVLPCCRMGSPPRLRTTQREAILPSDSHGGESGETDAFEAGVDETR